MTWDSGVAESSKGLFKWSGGPWSSGVGFFCFHALEDTKQKKPNPTRPGSPTPCKQGLKQSFVSSESRHKSVISV